MKLGLDICIGRNRISQEEGASVNSESRIFVRGDERVEEHRIAKYKRIIESGGFRYRFFCDLSGALVCISDLQTEDSPMQAWVKNGRAMFSQCHRCGRWVSDPMYNAETWQCVECSPWEEKPAFCPQCGEPVVDDDVFCHRCHARLRYRETEGWDESTAGI